MNKWALGIGTSVATAIAVSLVMWFFGAFSEGQSAITDAHIREIAVQEIEKAGSVAPHRMDQAEKDIGELKATDEKFDSKIDRIIDILLED